MTGYRQMRRQARQARRAGMQPMMVINSGDPLPELAAVVISRLLWRYRSELAPVPASAAVFVLGWWAHATFGVWWQWACIVIGAVLAAWALWAFGTRIGIAALLERLYVALCVFTAGLWIALAAALGPASPPLPHALGAAALALAVPWWTNRRRRAKVRVERTLASWPQIARDVGLPGSQVLSATVGVWGWRARLRLSRGQTIADVIGRIPALESGLGVFRGAVRHLPDVRQARQPMRTAGDGRRPPRSCDPLAWPVRQLDHRTDRPRPVRGRLAVPSPVPASGTACSEAAPDPARAAA